MKNLNGIKDYCLNAVADEETDFIEINEEKYFEIKKAKRAYFEILKIEEIYFNLLKNYKEYEVFLFEKSLDSIIYMDYSWDTLKESIHEFDRRIFNFISQVRLYFDQTKGMLKNIYGKNSEEFNQFKLHTNKCYDESFSYRLMEAIRNYTQHYIILLHVNKDLFNRYYLFINKL